MKEPKLVFSFVPVAVLSPLSPPQVRVLACKCLCLCGVYIIQVSGGAGQFLFINTGAEVTRQGVEL